MLEAAFLLAFSSLVALASLGIVLWILITGRFLSMDGLLMTSIALLFIVIFGGDAAWSFHKGEAQAVLSQFLKKPSQTPSSGDNPPGPA